MKPDGTRCRCIIARKNLDTHYVRTSLNIRTGELLCMNHWKVVHSGRKVRTQTGLSIFTPQVRMQRGAVAASGVIPIHRKEKCPRCGLGFDTNGDGDCVVCARLTDDQVKARKGKASG
jgi:hypothetical protein